MMKRLLLFISAIPVVGIICVQYNKCNRDVYDYSDTLSDIDTIPAVEEVQVIDSVIPDSSGNTSRKYYGDTLFQYDGKTVIYDYFYSDNESYSDDEEITSLPPRAIITYRDTVPVHTCIVNNDDLYLTDGETLKYFFGVDTVYYNLKRLPKAIYPERKLLPKEVWEHSYLHRFALSDSSRKYIFAFRAYLPDNSPAWIRQFIATIMNNDIQALFTDNKGADKILREYYDIKSTPRKLHGLDASQKTPEEIARHFSKIYERLYRKEYGGVDSDKYNPEYDYSMFVVPAWQSKDSTYVTYRFYTYYTMGGHGFMEEYYLTFNSETGELLGFKDLFRNQSREKVISELDTNYSERRRENGYNVDGIEESWLSEGELESNTWAIIKEKCDTVYYPRPAMTKIGVVFSYQPYEAVAFSHGIIHILIPYSKIKSALKIKR